MTWKKIGKITFIVLIFITLLIIAYSKFFNKEQTVELEPIKEEREIYSSNIIKDVKYTTKDAEGN